MFFIELSWKEYNIYLPMVEDWMKINTEETYVGNSADSSLKLWFSAEPSTEVQEAIQTYWNSLNAESEESITYVSRQDLMQAAEDLKTGLLEKSWDEMSVAERKLVLGQTPTREELGL